MEVYPCQPICRRNESSAWNVSAGDQAVRDLLRIERLAVENEFRVKLSGPPTSDHCPDRILTNAQQIAERLQIRSECYHLADI